MLYLYSILLYNSITYIQVEYLLKRFANIDTNKDGMISVEDLAVFLKVPHDNCLQSVFNSFDTVSASYHYPIIIMSDSNCNTE